MGSSTLPVASEEDRSASLKKPLSNFHTNARGFIRADFIQKHTNMQSLAAAVAMAAAETPWSCKPQLPASPARLPAGHRSGPDLPAQDRTKVWRLPPSSGRTWNSGAAGSTGVGWIYHNSFDLDWTSFTCLPPSRVDVHIWGVGSEREMRGRVQDGVSRSPGDGDRLRTAGCPLVVGYRLRLHSLLFQLSIFLHPLLLPRLPVSVPGGSSPGSVVAAHLTAEAFPAVSQRGGLDGGGDRAGGRTRRGQR